MQKPFDNVIQKANDTVMHKPFDTVRPMQKPIDTVMQKASDTVMQKPSDTQRGRRRRRRMSFGLTQHLFNGARIAARKAICGILWLGVMFLFIGILLLVTTKQKGL